MAVDHLLGDDPGLEDPPTLLLCCGLTLALAAVVFGRVVPRARAGDRRRAARHGLACSVLALVPGVAALWLGLPFVLAGGGIALGLRARGTGRAATAAIVIGGLVLLLGTGLYAVQAVDKLA